MDLDLFRKMVAKNPRGFVGRFGLGKYCFQEDGNLDEGVEHLTVVTPLDPTHVASHLALTLALIGLGKKDEAEPTLTAGIDAAVSGRSGGETDLVPEL